MTATLCIASHNVGMQMGQRICASAARTFLLEDADVLCMQEARPLFGNTFLDNSHLAELCDGFDIFADGPYLTRAKKRHGLHVESLELPLFGSEDFSKPEEKRKYASRSFQQVMVSKSGVASAVLNVHCRCGTATDTALAFRRKALRNVKHRAEALVGDGTVRSAVIAGDVNVPPEEIRAELGPRWQLELSRGDKRDNGKHYWDAMAFLTLSPVQCSRQPSALGFGRGQLSDAHGAVKVQLADAPTEIRWTRYASDEGCWWAKGDPAADETMDWFLEAAANARGWYPVVREGEHGWANGDEFFYVRSGRASF